MRSMSRHTWFLALAVLVVPCLGAFWTLLGYYYSPEIYRASPEAPGNFEIVCMLACAALTIFLLLSSSRRPDECHRRFNAILAPAAAACFVLAKQFLGFRTQCLDPILFCTACGWAIALWLRDRSASSRLGLLAITVVSAAIGLFLS